ncbi:uncharacterized protein LOC125759334 [Rhipicephalus sanguineus]|uniref:uncharacterized protein LOC125759334 n=1 Tax=Rhipicephalus sanguineus TaxID=34632 RepID=UPI0020C54F10|nr:uncharacterized protein LOC125759334 [Rhipicephalus sanguineus]
MKPGNPCHGIVWEDTALYDFVISDKVPKLRNVSRDDFGINHSICTMRCSCTKPALRSSVPSKGAPNWMSVHGASTSARHKSTLASTLPKSIVPSRWICYQQRVPKHARKEPSSRSCSRTRSLAPLL